VTPSWLQNSRTPILTQSRLSDRILQSAVLQAVSSPLTDLESVSLWQTFFVLVVGAQIPSITGMQPAKKKGFGTLPPQNRQNCPLIFTVLVSHLSFSVTFSPHDPRLFLFDCNLSSLIHFPLLRYPIPPLHLVSARLSPPAPLVFGLSLQRHPSLYIPSTRIKIKKSDQCTWLGCPKVQFSFCFQRSPCQDSQSQPSKVTIKFVWTCSNFVRCQELNKRIFGSHPVTCYVSSMKWSRFSRDWIT
jgi:hypothetical protein